MRNTIKINESLLFKNQKPEDFKYEGEQIDLKFVELARQDYINSAHAIDDGVKYVDSKNVQKYLEYWEDWKTRYSSGEFTVSLAFLKHAYQRQNSESK